MDISSEQNKLIVKGFLVLFAVMLLSYVANINIVYSSLRAVLGLAFVLFIPGYIATYTFFKSGEVDALERIALSVALSISLVVLTVMFSNLYLGIPINLLSIVLEIGIICAFFVNIIFFRRNFRSMVQYELFLLRVINPIVSKLTFAGDPNRKKKLFMVFGISLIALFLAVDIFYPYIFIDPVEEERMFVPTIAEPYNLSDLYDESMAVYRFYSQKGVSENITNVSISRPWVVSFDDKIVFLGYDIDNSVLSAGGTFHIKYYWKCMEEFDEDYRVFVHVTDIDDTIIFQQDHELPIKTSLLKKGDIVMEEYDVRVPSNIENGVYLMKIGLYDRDEGGRLPIVSGRLIDSNSRAIIARIDIVFGIGEQEEPEIEEPVELLNISESYNISMTVRHFYPAEDVEEELTGIEIQNSAVMNFDNTIMFLGYDLDKATLKPGETFHITYFWKSIEVVDADYDAKVYITNDMINDYDFVLTSTGRLAFRHDHKFPVDTTSWSFGDVIMEEYDVTVPADMEAGTYDIGIGVENSETGRMLMQVSGADSIATIEIED